MLVRIDEYASSSFKKRNVNNDYRSKRTIIVVFAKSKKLVIAMKKWFDKLIKLKFNIYVNERSKLIVLKKILVFSRLTLFVMLMSWRTLQFKLFIRLLQSHKRKLYKLFATS